MSVKAERKNMLSSWMKLFILLKEKCASFPSSPILIRVPPLCNWHLTKKTKKQKKQKIGPFIIIKYF